MPHSEQSVVMKIFVCLKYFLGLTIFLISKSSKVFNFVLIKNLGLKKSLGPKTILSQNNCGLKECWAKKILGCTFFWPNKFWVEKIVSPNFF